MRLQGILQRGFTLIEMMIVVAIIGILYAVAMPAYSEYMEKGRRADMQQNMLQVVAVLERTYSRMGGYPSNFTLPTSDYYTLRYAPQPTISSSGGAHYDAKKFTLRAIPKAAQSGDECGTLSINEVGQQRASSGDDDDCWGN